MRMTLEASWPVSSQGGADDALKAKGRSFGMSSLYGLIGARTNASKLQLRKQQNELAKLAALLALNSNVLPSRAYALLPS